MLVLRRPPVLLCLHPLLRCDMRGLDAAFLGWFGPVGVAALYYGTFAARETGDPAVWPLAEPRWALYQDNRSVWRAVFEQCDAAERSIDLEQYIFSSRGVGRELLDLLAATARGRSSARAGASRRSSVPAASPATRSAARTASTARR